MGGMSLTVDGEPVDLSKTVSYKGMMLSGVPNFTHGHRLHQRLLDAEGRPGQPLRLPAAQPPRRRAATSSATPVAPPEGADLPFLDLASGYVQRSLDELPKQGVAHAVAAAPELHPRRPADAPRPAGGRGHDLPAAGSRPRPSRRSPDGRLRVRRRDGGRHRRGQRDRCGAGRASWPPAAATWSWSTATRSGWTASPTACGAAHPRLAVDTYVVDLVRRRRHRPRRPTPLAAAHPETTLLVNNAGVALGGRFDQVTLEEFDWVMAVNFRSVVRLTHAFLPALKAHPGSHLVNVSSVFGIFAPARAGGLRGEQVRRPRLQRGACGTSWPRTASA